MSHDPQDRGPGRSGARPRAVGAPDSPAASGRTPDPFADTIAGSPAAGPSAESPPADEYRGWAGSSSSTNERPLPRPDALLFDEPHPPAPSRRDAGALEALAIGWARMRENTRLWLFVWLTSLVAAILATAPALIWLNSTLEKRPAALRLARGEADALFVELLGDATGVPSALICLALLGVLAHWLLHVLLSGGLLSALRRDPQGPRTLAQVLARAGETAGAMFRLELVYILLVRLPLCAAIVAGGVLLSRGPQPQTQDLPTLVERFGPLVGVALLGWSMSSVGLSVARTARLLQAQDLAHPPRALRAVGTALRRGLFSFAGLRALLALALTSLLGTVGLLLIGRLAAAQLDYLLLLPAAFAVRQAAALVRSMLSVLVMAGATAIADGAD
ncbi:MAG: hypothetical protein U1A78_35975 [Polyangia bacterium]